MLGRSGIGWRRTATLAGVSTGVVSRLLYGGTGDRPPARRVRPETAAALLAVRPSPETIADQVLVGATGTHRCIQALVTIGSSQQSLAGQLGMLRSNFGQVMRRERITAGTARAVAALYDELWNRQPPESARWQRIAANRARNYARAAGWAPPAAWDDDRIDDPDAAPADGWQRQARLGSEDLAGEARELAALGLTRQQAAERLGVNRRRLIRPSPVQRGGPRKQRSGLLLVLRPVRKPHKPHDPKGGGSCPSPSGPATRFFGGTSTRADFAARRHLGCCWRLTT